MNKVSFVIVSPSNWRYTLFVFKMATIESKYIRDKTSANTSNVISNEMLQFYCPIYVESVVCTLLSVVYAHRRYVSMDSRTTIAQTSATNTQIPFKLLLELRYPKKHLHPFQQSLHRTRNLCVYCQHRCTFWQCEWFQSMFFGFRSFRLKWRFGFAPKLFFTFDVFTLVQLKYSCGTNERTRADVAYVIWSMKMAKRWISSCCTNWQMYVGWRDLRPNVYRF